MPVKTESREIGGMLITVTQLPAMRAFELGSKLIKMIGPALAAMDVSALGPALAGAMARLDPAEFSALARLTLSCATAVDTGPNGKSRVVPLDRDETINAVFSGRLRTMLAAIKFSLEINFADFFAGAGASAPPSPPVANG